MSDPNKPTPGVPIAASKPAAVTPEEYSNYVDQPEEYSDYVDQLYDISETEVSQLPAESTKGQDPTYPVAEEAATYQDKRSTTPFNQGK